jgi:DNA-binding transcriptional LysR family regulator
LRAFKKRYPGIGVVLDASDLPADPQRDEFDVALRATHGFSKTAGSDALALLPLELVAAPALLVDLPRAAAARLAKLPQIALASGVNRGLYVAHGRDGTALRVGARVGIVVNNGIVAKEFAALGFGAALAIGVSVASDIRRGRLARVAPSLDFGRVALRPLFRDRRPSPAAAAFVAFLAQSASQND